MNDLGKFILLTGLYFGTGKLGLLMAVPPGYATAVWPPSGFAFAGILIFGYRFWPSIWLGSFLVNIGNSIDASSAITIFKALAPATIIALGASIQAIVGAKLVRHYVKHPIILIREKEVFKFVMFSSVVSCLIAPTLGVLTLVGSGEIQWSSATFSWWTWWVGDCIGVLIFGPLMMMFLAEPKKIWRKRIQTVAIPMVGVFILVVILFVFMKNYQEKRIKNEFDAQAQLMISSLDNNINRYFDILYALRSFYEGSNVVDRQEFHLFVKNFFKRHKGVAALEWDPKVLHEERAQFEEAVQKDIGTDYYIKELGHDRKIQKASARKFYFPIMFAEPYKENQAVMGFDFMSEHSRVSALEIAWRTGELALTKPIDLIQGPKGIIAFLAIYHNGKSIATDQERINQLNGFVVEVLRIEDVFKESLTAYADKEFVFNIFDRDPEMGDLVLLTESLKNEKLTFDQIKHVQKVSQGLFYERQISLGGRQWYVQVYPTTEYFIGKQSWSMWFVLAGGLLFIGFLGGFLLVMTGRETLITNLVDERTKELHETNKKFQQGMVDLEKMAQAVEYRNKELEQARIVALNIAQDAQEEKEMANKAREELKRTFLQLEDSNKRLEGLNDELTLLNDQLKKVDSLKSEFTSMVSHELRTPLTVIKESVAIVYDESAGPINPDQKDFLETAKRNVDRLGRLINDVLDYQKLESNFMEFKMEEQSINDVVEEVGKGFKLVLENKGLTLDLKLNNDLPRIKYDKDKITQVLTNLISNAMKFTTEGKITLITEKVGENAIKVSVQDQGMGIKTEDLDKLFKSFSQISTGAGRQTGGTGLGLALSKKIIEHHHGKVGVNSVYGQGSTFYFVFPINDRRKRV